MGIHIRAVSTIALTLGVSVFAAQVSLKELARLNGGRATTVAEPNLPVTTMPECHLAKRARRHTHYWQIPRRIATAKTLP
jgi:hypothetical protein